MSIFTYGFRVNKIFKNENETAFFTPSEIVSAIVNLLDAKKLWHGMNISSCLWYSKHIDKSKGNFFYPKAALLDYVMK